MRVFIAALAVETVSSSTFPVGMRSFEEVWLRRGDGTSNARFAGQSPPGEWRRMAEADGHDVVESVTAIAQSAGLVVRRVYEELRDQILEDLTAAMPVDVVLLYLHGSMAADGYDDCEGDLTERVRAIVGPDAAIGLELDLHAYLTEKMVDNATAIIAFKEYPHVDHMPRARELYDICTEAAEGVIKPTSAVEDLRMISLWRTSGEPVRGFVDKIQALEGRDGVLSISFIHANPWLDVENNGARMLVITDDNPEQAAALAKSLGEEIWALREATRTPYMEIGEALDRVENGQSFPIVLADVADNAGGGAPSDSTFLLAPILERGLQSVAFGCIWDPVSVGICFDAGLGANLDLRIGGKCGPVSGSPLDLTVQVMGLARNHTQTGINGGSSVARLGDAAWVRVEGVDIVLNSLRSQVFASDAFTGLGIDLEDKVAIVVKSTQHFYSSFSKLAGEIIYVTSDGTLRPDFENLKFSKNLRPYWPKVADPFE